MSLDIDPIVLDDLDVVAFTAPSNRSHHIGNDTKDTMEPLKLATHTHILQEPDIARESPWAPNATIHSLPPELMLSIFPSMPLKSLIHARGVSKEWRHFIDVSFIYPARRTLLEFYYQVIKSPSFLESRKHLISQLRDLDREEYISTIESETNVPLPDEFRLWVLEWPLKAVPTWLWPGLDSAQPRDLHGVFPRQTMNLLKSFGIRPRKIHLRHRSTSDDTVVLRPMRHTEANDCAHDWCWMIIVQVARDPFAMDFLLFGGEGLGTGVKDRVLVVKDDVVRPGMKWVEYLASELQKQDECYLKKRDEGNSSSFLNQQETPLTPPPRSSRLARLRVKLRWSVRHFIDFCSCMGGVAYTSARNVYRRSSSSS
ncbi:hypothetical protein EIP91_012351 [Steccherinum ochraceum]|uniref:F-box domain-containing protein n=1 Tax=Steccherinum ochraceum TaxID=92696 RepID=A0A4R0RGG2_9APHY|nr:hypothetical protein EIP91_012351 [Steccherinum ochraceum]